MTLKKQYHVLKTMSTTRLGLIITIIITRVFLLFRQMVIWWKVIFTIIIKILEKENRSHNILMMRSESINPCLFRNNDLYTHICSIYAYPAFWYSMIPLHYSFHITPLSLSYNYLFYIIISSNTVKSQNLRMKNDDDHRKLGSYIYVLLIWLDIMFISKIFFDYAF